MLHSDYHFWTTVSLRLELEVEVVIGDPSCVASHSPPSSHPFFLIVDDDDDEWLISPSPSPATLLRALRFRPPHDISQRRVCAPLDAGTPPSRLWRQQQYAGVGTVRHRHRRGRAGGAGWKGGRARGYGDASARIDGQAGADDRDRRDDWYGPVPRHGSLARAGRSC